MTTEFKVTQALLMAAGLGTRLQPFTHEKTKALLPVLGIPIVQYAVDSLVRSGVERLVANVHHHAKKTSQQLSDINLGTSQLILSDESSLLLGSGGGVKKACSYFDEGPFFRSNADVICNVNWEELGRTHRRLRERFGTLLTLAVMPGSGGSTAYPEIIYDPKTSLIQKIGAPASCRPFFMGAAVIEKEAFSDFKDGVPFELVPEIFLPAIQAKRAGVYLSQGFWYDIGEASLWRDTHFSLIKELRQFSDSSSTLPSLARQWLDQIELINEEIAPDVWVSKGSPRSVSRERHWSGPCYWDGRGVGESQAPRGLGPYAVLYGPRSLDLHQDGIGFNGLWTKILRKKCDLT